MIISMCRSMKWSWIRLSFIWGGGRVVRRKIWWWVKFRLRSRPSLEISLLEPLHKWIRLSMMNCSWLLRWRKMSCWKRKVLLRKYWCWSLVISRYLHNWDYWLSQKTLSVRYLSLTTPPWTKNNCNKPDKHKYSTFSQSCSPQFSSPSKSFTWRKFCSVTRITTHWISLMKKDKSVRTIRFTISFYLPSVKSERAPCWV